MRWCKRFDSAGYHDKWRIAWEASVQRKTVNLACVWFSCPKGFLCSKDGNLSKILKKKLIFLKMIIWSRMIVVEPIAFIKAQRLSIELTMHTAVICWTDNAYWLFYVELTKHLILYNDCECFSFSLFFLSWSLEMPLSAGKTSIYQFLKMQSMFCMEIFGR